jgi:chromosome segregation ATPase
MRRVFFFFSLCVIVLALTLVTASAQPSNCDDLMKAVNEAQSAYNKALGAWRQATVKVIQAVAAVAEAEAKIKANDKAQIAAIGALEAAKADQAACESAAKGGSLAPLADCSKVADRISKAEKDYAALGEANKTLEENLKNKQQEVEDREQDATNAHAVERQAWATLEAAKKAAAGCKKMS